MGNDRHNHHDLWEFAKSIIMRVPKFREFAVSMMDYAGDVTYEVFAIYIELRYSGLPADVKLDSIEEISRYNVDDLTGWYNEFQKQQKEKYEEEKKKVKDGIDELQYLIEDYRNSDKFKEMLDFVGRFRYLAPYNAMLVEMQKPGASFVFPAKKWMMEYNRQPKPNAQKLITLVPFGPVQVMFDFEDTVKIPGEIGCVEREDLMEAWESILTKTKGEVAPRIWENLMINLPNYGICYDANFIASNSYGGYLLRTDRHAVLIQTNREVIIMQHPARFVLSVNRNQKPVSQFHTICHELGHLFCRHLFYKRERVRHLTLEQQEFEAETVAWLVCRRHGISNPSEQYLALYSRDGTIPNCSLDAIMRAVAEIEKMMEDIVPIKKTMWYLNDEKYKDAVDKELKSQKAHRRGPTLF